MDAERIESIPHRWDGHGSRDRRATATDSGRPPRPKELVLARAWGHNPCARPAPPPACTLPANVAADDDVGQGHVSVLIECGTTPAVMGNSIGAVLTMRMTIARARGLEDGEEWPVEAVLELDDLLVVVRALEELDARVERAAIGLQQHCTLPS